MQQFIDKAAANFAGLEIKYIKGANPKLAMRKGVDGAPNDDIELEAYRTEDIVAFLEQKFVLGDNEQENVKKATE